MKRVVVTGMGAVSAFGSGSETLWQALLAGENGIKSVQQFPLKGDIVAIAASMPELSQEIAANKKLANTDTEDPAIRKFFLAVEEAVNQSGINFDDPVYQESACMIADRPYSPTLDVDTYIKDYALACPDGNTDLDRWLAQLKRSPEMYKRAALDDVDSINHFAARYYNLTGPSLSIGTACASGNNAIGEAFEKIRRGRLTSAIVGGAYDFDVNTMIGFTRIGALTTNPDPDSACSPFDAKRSGFVMGSGCGVLILEELESAQRRGAKILAEVTGYGSFTDGYRATDPDPEGRAAIEHWLVPSRQQV
ncbi:beta-ketoacyl synthase N-terminal-like domain-containing protein [Vibrio mexicanus]|uniref:beta-ketoacyl synthase N-terminal-like domain-containing protein n=1 Tax=Vibrio mexicanus TaxID=1004326 RepID=UPI00069C1D13|nr:beta-ketoacyl synthase N-terminal-like domain-containing protein [Vibrio mexicanus]